MNYFSSRRVYWLMGIVWLGGILACGGTSNEVLPTPIATAFLPTLTTEPPTATATSSAAALTPTLTATPTVTPVFATPETEPGAAAINITSPPAESTVLTGSVLTVSGLSGVSPEQKLVIRLVTVGGNLLDETMAKLDSNTFQANIQVPITITGAAQIQAQVQTISGEVVAMDTLSVRIGANAAANPRYLELYRPVVNSKVVGGYYLFFDGYAAQPTGTVFIAVYTDNCQTEAAATSFRVSSSSYWQGYLYIPNTLSGAGCAMARFGAPGAENWREAQVPINLQRPTEEGAYAIYLFSPTQQSELVGGSNVSFWGTAYNASDDLVVISLLREDGVNLAQGSATVDSFGYWETTLNIPLNYTGIAQIVTAIGNPGQGNVAQAVITVTILPAPTPTPEGSEP